jgi:hypothetical protein
LVNKSSGCNVSVFCGSLHTSYMIASLFLIVKN